MVERYALVFEIVCYFLLILWSRALTIVIVIFYVLRLRGSRLRLAEVWIFSIPKALWSLVYWVTLVGLQWTGGPKDDLAGWLAWVLQVQIRMIPSVKSHLDLSRTQKSSHDGQWPISPWVSLCNYYYVYVQSTPLPMKQRHPMPLWLKEPGCYYPGSTHL